MKAKKEEEYKKAASLTSQILSKNLNNYGNKLRSRVTQHMINNNVLANKEIDPSRKRGKRKITIKKKLKPVEEASVEESEESNKGSKRRPGKERDRTREKER